MASLTEKFLNTERPNNKVSTDSFSKKQSPHLLDTKQPSSKNYPIPHNEHLPPVTGTTSQIKKSHISAARLVKLSSMLDNSENTLTCKSSLTRSIPSSEVCHVTVDSPSQESMLLETMASSIATKENVPKSLSEQYRSDKGDDAEALPSNSPVSHPHHPRLFKHTRRYTLDDQKMRTESSSPVPPASMQDYHRRATLGKAVLRRNQVVRDLPHLPSAELAPVLPAMPAEAITYNRESEGGLWDLLSSTDIVSSCDKKEIDGLGECSLSAECTLSRHHRTKMSEVEVQQSNATSATSSSHSHTLPNFRKHETCLIYVERKGGHGFVPKKLHTDKVAISDSSQYFSYITSTEYVLILHTFIQQISIIAHGLIAGISLWECIFTNLVGCRDEGHLAILLFHNSSTLPSQALHLLLLSLVLLSLLDRFDIANPRKLSVQSLIRTPSHIIMLMILLLVLCALVVSLSLLSLDERIALFPQEPSLWSEFVTIVNTSSYENRNMSVLTFPFQENFFLVYVPSVNSMESKSLLSYLALLIVRGVCCCLSWIAAILITDYDRFRDYLETFKSDQQSSSQPKDTER